MFLLKGCPRCRGDLSIVEILPDDWEANCLQCGYSAAVPDLVLTRWRATSGRLSARVESDANRIETTDRVA